MSRILRCRFARLRNRGMVTAELAIGILTATMVAIALSWGVHLLAVQTECSDVAAQIARAEARGDSAAADEARQRAPSGAKVTVDTSGSGVQAKVAVAVAFGNLFAVTVTGDATMPKEPGT